MIKIKSYETGEVQQLNRVLMEAQKALGLDEPYMRAFKVLKGLSEDQLKELECYELVIDTQIIAFYGMKREIHHEVDLQYFAVCPEFQHQELGRRLWHHLIQFCEQHGILKIHLLTNPETQRFFEKMGCEVIGTCPSKILKERDLTLMQFKGTYGVSEETDHGLTRSR